MIGKKLGLKENIITTNFGRQSGTVALENACISMPDLKRADRWASISTLDQYVEHSHASKAERVALFDEKTNSNSKKEMTTAIMAAATTATVTTMTP
eukprot:2600695-Ditylum_brightwellii.AAC.1